MRVVVVVVQVRHYLLPHCAAELWFKQSVSFLLMAYGMALHETF